MPGREDVELLTSGELRPEGQLVDASNVALRCEVIGSGRATRALYKPVRGERPLWDFPEGTLAAREVAAYEVSELGGWGIVPPTVLRDGPFGPGSLQLWIEESTEAPDPLVDVVPADDVPDGWLPVLEAEGQSGEPLLVVHADRPELAAMAVLDTVLNNADRKASHLRLDVDGHLHGFDHGVTFHVEPKLRTVLWGWAGRPLPKVEQDRLSGLAEQLAKPSTPLPRRLARLISPAEVRALRERTTALLAAGCYPKPSIGWQGRPAIPWPLW